MSHQVHVIDHPLVQHKLTLIREVSRSTKSFRELVTELSALLAYEVTRDMPMHEVQIQTPLEPMTSRLIDGKKIVFVVQDGKAVKREVTTGLEQGILVQILEGVQPGEQVVEKRGV